MSEIVELDKLALIKLDDLIKNLGQKKKEGSERNATSMCS